DLLVHYGHHFGHTVHALCNIHALITSGLLHDGECADDPEESFTTEQRLEYCIYRTLLNMVPDLEECLVNSSDEETQMIADLLQKGASSARSDDTKGLKSTVLNWIVPQGDSLTPPIPRNVKSSRRFNHDKTGQLLCLVEFDWSDEEVKAQLMCFQREAQHDQWPILLYKEHKYDPEDPWDGLLRSAILVSAYKYIFTSPSSVEKEPKAMHSGNAHIHGMTQVTMASIAYIVTQVRFTLSSSTMFTRSDMIMDSEHFYNSILQFLEDADENNEADALLIWWNHQIFPTYSSAQRPVTKNSALAKLKEKRAALKAQNHEL
ncbi:hypothetical protein L208DRAFT_1305560, partial [Tricholoma matsutake]